jgi:hypothetical protein
MIGCLVASGPGADWGVAMVDWAMETYRWPVLDAVFRIPIYSYFALQDSWLHRHNAPGHIGLADRASIRARAASEAAIRAEYDIIPNPPKQCPAKA